MRRTITFLLLLCAALAQARSLDHEAGDLNARTRFLSVTVRAGNGTYELRMPADVNAALRARVAVKIDNTWISTADYPHHQLSATTFANTLGAGRQIIATSAGLSNRPDLTYIIRLYDALPFADLEIEVYNRTSKAMTVQSIRGVEAIGQPLVNLHSAESADRILSDSFSEDWQRALPIYDLGKAPDGVHLAVGSQLIYNGKSGRSLFVGALTSERFITVMRLRARPGAAGTRIMSYTVDSTGTTEVQAPYWHPSAEDRIELSLPLGPGSKLSSERLMLAMGTDYHAQLEAYGAAVRQLHHARVQGDNLLGWWSWLPYYTTISDGAVLTTARWLAAHLQPLGYEFLQIDEGYAYARGEYATPNATNFPRGMRGVAQDVGKLGLKLGIWAAPFHISNRSWIYERHQDWLVHNARGKPLFLGRERDLGEDMYALDPTHPDAQEYLRQTYRRLVREWGVRYIKLDFMDSTTVEGYYHRPDTSALEAQRIGLEVIRKAVGEDVLLDKDAGPMLNAVGIVDEGRISGDTEHSYQITKARAPGIAARYYMHRNFFVNDPDAFSVQEAVRPAAAVTGTPQAPLSLNEAQVAIVLAAVSGGMFEIGDDLPTLGAEPDRLGLVTNADLLQMARLGRASLPVDLLTYSPEDEQPSVFLLREDRRQAMLAVFNWTERPRSRTLRLTQLGLPSGRELRLYDVLASDQPSDLDGETIRVGKQPARSVRLIKIIDGSTPAGPPTITSHAPTNTRVGEKARFSADAAEDGVPALSYHWDFGDGTGADGQAQEHAYTLRGTYAVRLRADGVDGVPAHASFPVAVEDEATAQEAPRRYLDPTD